jgi:hypothetical protein
MTVKELISLLEEFPQDSPVQVEAHYNDYVCNCTGCTCGPQIIVEQTSYSEVDAVSFYNVKDGNTTKLVTIRGKYDV